MKRRGRRKNGGKEKPHLKKATVAEPLKSVEPAEQASASTSSPDSFLGLGENYLDLGEAMAGRFGSKNTEEPTQEEAELSDAVINGIRFGMNNVNKFIHETLPKCSTDERKKKMADKMESLLLRLVKAEMTYTRATGIVTEAVEEMPDDPEADAQTILKTCDNIADTSMKRIKQYEKTVTENDLKQNPTYIRMIKDMETQLAAQPGDDDDDSDQEESASGGQDEDEEEEEEEDDEEPEVQNEDLIPTTDPITMQLLKDPVRNKKCGHIYGKASISQMIRQNNKTRCPIPGCSNKDFLRAAHLAVDRKLTAEIKKKQAEMSKPTGRRRR